MKKPDLPKYIYMEQHTDNSITMRYIINGSGETRYEETRHFSTPQQRRFFRQDFLDFTQWLFRNELSRF